MKGPVKTREEVTYDDEELMRIAGERLRIRRNVRDMTQQEVADLAGVSQTHINRIEMGKSNTTPTNWRRFADYLGVGIGYFWGSEQEQRLAETIGGDAMVFWHRPDIVAEQLDYFLRELKALRREVERAAEQQTSVNERLWRLLEMILKSAQPGSANR